MRTTIRKMLLTVEALLVVSGCDDGDDNLKAEYGVHPMKAETDLENATTVKQIDAAIHQHVSMMKETREEMLDLCQEYDACPNGGGISAVQLEVCQWVGDNVSPEDIWTGDIVSPEDMTSMKSNEQRLLDVVEQERTVCDENGLAESDCTEAYKNAALDQIRAFKGVLEQIKTTRIILALAYEVSGDYCSIEDAPDA